VEEPKKLQRMESAENDDKRMESANDDEGDHEEDEHEGAAINCST